MKKYRIDTFPNHEKHWFDTKENALQFGREQVKNGKNAFLLEHRLDDCYEVVEQIEA